MDGNEQGKIGGFCIVHARKSKQVNKLLGWREDRGSYGDQGCINKQSQRKRHVNNNKVMSVNLTLDRKHCI